MINEVKVQALVVILWMTSYKGRPGAEKEEVVYERNHVIKCQFEYKYNRVVSSDYDLFLFTGFRVYNVVVNKIVSDCFTMLI